MCCVNAARQMQTMTSGRLRYRSCVNLRFESGRSAVARLCAWRGMVFPFRDALVSRCNDHLELCKIRNQLGSTHWSSGRARIYFTIERYVGVFSRCFTCSHPASRAATPTDYFHVQE